MGQRSMMASIFTSFQNDFKSQPPAAHTANVEKILADKLGLFKEGRARANKRTPSAP
jgi:hypothetical protein